MPSSLGHAVALAGSFGLAVACAAGRYTSERGPEVAFPAHILEGRAKDAGAGETGPTPSATDAATGDAASPQPAGSLPDPEPLRLAHQWRYTILYDRGKVSVSRVEGLLFPKPVVTARQMGRYAIELWIGHELVDRVRFDFPLLGAEEPSHGPRHPLHEPPTLAAGAVVTRQVLVPASSRATRAVLVDRASGARQPLPWPPRHPLPPPGAPERAPDASGPALPAAPGQGPDAGAR